ncbi:diacylglycerol acyltransferase-domain-containing protein [Gongronella butleri]|nr:diacylglycerol acyltransferase-domain-containing protein [Gongronella butleri]
MSTEIATPPPEDNDKLQNPPSPPPEEETTDAHAKTADNAADGDTLTATNAKQAAPLREEAIEDDAHHVRWAPLHIPFQRRLQMAAMLFWISLLFICLSWFAYLFLIPALWPVALAYLAFLYVDKAPETGGRRVNWVRHWTIWKYFAGYFPAQLIKEADLDPSRNYVLGYHPHGVISFGAVANFATEATGFSELFPGIVPSLLTLVSNFKLPFYRDVIMAMGIAAVSRRSCESILSSGPGRSIVIVVGGASESLSARPGIADLTLKKRLGFIRLAIVHQACLVPCFSFGENDIYEQVANDQGSMIWKFQKMVQNYTGFTLPLFHARGIFNYDVGIIPFRHPIVTVVGRPIDVPKLEPGAEPTHEQLVEVQAAYIDELQSIYDKYKDVYAKDRIKDLCLVA